MKFIEENITAFNVQATTPEKAIRIAGNLLADNGYVEKRYVEAMVESFEKNGPYIVIAPQIAMPHARPEDGVLEACISMIKLETPIPFGSTPNDPVKLVFALGASDSEEHLKVLKKLMNLLGNKEAVEQLKAATSYESIRGLIE
ncbi:PTS sugar transporter subunit IIA [Lederbergia panacisoli]|uniref:PTS sugar transporter subunit IIA n=1 Tax=Lederbergia panacisoli TaxID=1255251 RepID=UPI00214C3F96|nr:PTS sugar transporter subunit IIA [Lederbergia panacisoli]MCR2822923.1 PTS sugar transporter subunit IIA [Lederbergia panacisoli]